MNEIERFWESFFRFHRGMSMNSRFRQCDKITTKWGIIRQAYMENIPAIMRTAEEDISMFYAPNFLDWRSFLSPIEIIAWESIRTTCPLYPQLPLFNYFIDFANPFLRIGLELDGKAYHDEEKDEKRDNFLASYGWKIFRVDGVECHREYKDAEWFATEMVSEEEKEEEMHKWIMGTADGVIHAIAHKYFGRRDLGLNDHEELVENTLRLHRLAMFEI